MITVFLLSANFAMASVNVYMYSKVDVFGNEVSIDDIASVEDDNPNVVKKIEKTVIPKSLIKDGYLDAQNLVDYLKQIGYNNVKVYGNAVKINMLSPKTDTDIVDVVDEILVKTDMPVRVVLNKNKIQIGITGKALKNGRSGDDIPVKVRDKIIYCKIIGNNLVEKE
jgi:hypothetical protein